MNTVVLRQNLNELSTSLVELHRSLLQIQQRRHESARGMVSAGQLLGLAMSDPEFDWLHGVSRLIVDIDERMSSREPITWKEATAFRTRVEQRLGADSSELAAKLRDAVQEAPDAAIGLGRLRLALARLPSPGMALA